METDISIMTTTTRLIRTLVSHHHFLCPFVVTVNVFSSTKLIFNEFLIIPAWDYGSSAYLSETGEGDLDDGESSFYDPINRPRKAPKPDQVGVFYTDSLYFTFVA